MRGLKKTVSLILVAVTILCFSTLVTTAEVGSQNSSGFVKIAVGGSHSLGIKEDGSLWVWGFNLVGRLGDGTNITRYSPVKIMDGVVAIAAGAYHSLAIKSDGSLWAWGG